MGRKGRKRRFREARDLNRSVDDGLFVESDRTLADLYDDTHFATDGDEDDVTKQPEPPDQTQSE